MFDGATLTRFIEAFVAVFIVTLGGNAIFANGTVDFGTQGLHAIAIAIVASAAIAFRRALAVASK